jgi:GNAT superfamily N-acetyltransferase
MNDALAPIPRSLSRLPRCDVSVRVATAEDFAFIDSLQKLHSRQVGFLKRQAIEAKIAAGQALIAEDPHPNPLPEYREREKRVGYVMGQDRYFKHDNVGLIHQMNVAPDRQRGFIGMTLLKALFDRAAYGCLLYSCWCAQDIEANRFWESLGFVPLAYRGGSEKKRRLHIFWQKRIREGDVTTPYWYPAETTGGQMAEARLVLPIPPGKHWSDELPVLLPGAPAEPKQIPDQERKRRKAPAAKALAIAQRKPVSMHGRLFFTHAPERAAAKAEKAKPAKKPKAKNDPRLVAAARELRDRWLEKVNDDPSLLLSQGKYAVGRTSASSVAPELAAPPTQAAQFCLPAA